MSEHETSSQEQPDQRLLRELMELEARYTQEKPRLTADDMYRLWSALWRFEELVRADHRRLRSERRHRR
jgi:hypothetical protein